jgi:hypothetical protein
VPSPRIRSAVEEVAVLSETAYEDLPPSASRMGMDSHHKNLLVR